MLRDAMSHVLELMPCRLRYDSRSGTHNMYREYRDTTRAGAITQACTCSIHMLDITHSMLLVICPDLMLCRP